MNGRGARFEYTFRQQLNPASAYRNDLPVLFKDLQSYVQEGPTFFPGIRQEMEKRQREGKDPVTVVEISEWQKNAVRERKSFHNNLYLSDKDRLVLDLTSGADLQPSELECGKWSFAIELSEKGKLMQRDAQKTRKPGEKGTKRIM